MSRRRDRRRRYRNRRQDTPRSRRLLATVFAAAFGWIGVHRFILGQWQFGLIHVFLFVVSMSALENTPFGESPWLTISAFLAYATALWWARMSDEEFAERYLEALDDDEEEEVRGRYLSGKKVPNPKVKSRRARRKILAAAKARYEEFDYQGAAELYEEALDHDLSDGESRVYAARCYSLLEDADAAYRHLRRAVQLKASNLDTVRQDEGFAWLRTREDFERRRRAGYEPVALQEPAEPLQLGEPEPNILDGLERLAALKREGVLTDEEFARQKRRLLR